MDQPSSPQHLIVGIGASAGGLEAIEQLFKRMPVDTGLSFVVVQHLSPDFKSLMDELLSRWTEIPVKRVVDGMLVEPNSIYLIPRRKEMIVSQGRLLLTDKDPKETLTLPIDHFLRSLAQEADKRAVAVILSGTGSDGSRGIIDVHEAGGLVIAQREDTAKFDGMPLNAKNTGICDLLLAPDEIPTALVQYSIHAEREAVAATFEKVSVDTSGLDKIFTLLRDKYEIDFSQYKLNTIVRRTERRMIVNRIEHIDEYSDFLASTPGELHELYRDLLIGVTRFLRDKDSFEELNATAISRIVDEASQYDEVRVWVAGCSTGEEAYTVAILFKEAIAESDKNLNVKIFATDVDKHALEKAGNGIYPADSLVDMDPAWLEKYFSLNADGYQVNAEIRMMIVFALHNILKDAPFTKLDLITCRNLLIYFQPTAQKKVLSLFHFALKTQGFLMMGNSEGPGELSDEFAVESSLHKIYRKQRDVKLPADVRLQLTPPARAIRASGLPGLRGDEPVTGMSLIPTYDTILEKFMPPSVLVDEQGQILHTFTGAGRFLTNNDGRYSSNILDRVVEDLRVAISTAMRRCTPENEVSHYSNVPIHLGDGDKIICDLTVMLIEDALERFQSYLIQIFEHEEKLVDPDPSAALSFASLPAEQMSAMEAELRYVKESLQATIEELETSNEELQATNEELVASNEELQSTNEELHSVNEELYTVNSEHQKKITELSELTRDMDNLLQSTEIHTIFLDNELCIRKFTPNVAEKFNFLPQDIGRRIDQFTNNIDCEDIAERIEAVIEAGEISESEVQDLDGRWFLMRILPYRECHAEPDAKERNVEGVLLTLVDVTKLREVATELEESVQRRDEFLAMLSHELRNPLGAVLSALSVFATGDDERRNVAADVVKRQASHMSLLLDDLLDVSRVSQGKIQLDKETFELREIVEPAFEIVEPMFTQRNQQLGRLISGDAMFVLGSKPRLIQVLVNLLTNASKYSNVDQKIVLEIQRNGETGTIRVADNGAGIREDLLSKVFDMFAQSQRNLDRSDGGLGVGLTLVKSLVVLHGGKVLAKSEGEGKGSEFMVELPLVDPVHQPAPPVPNEKAFKTPANVVLVEDSIDAAKMLQFLLEDEGFEVKMAHDGKAGFELIKNTTPDIAIVDIGLPTLTGYQIAKQIREEASLDNLLLVALTGYGQEADREAALEAGFDDHMVKPLDPIKLANVLAKRSK